LQRSFASGLALTTALGHDFVLRRNCRIVMGSGHSTPFDDSTFGSHHVRLVSHIAALWNSLLSKEKGKAVARTNEQLIPLPKLKVVNSGENFGLVSSEYTTSFKGLLEVKEEVDEDHYDLHSISDNDIKTFMRQLDIDPALLALPEPGPSTSSASVMSSTVPVPICASDPTSVIGNLPSTSSALPTPNLPVKATQAGAKRKAAEPNTHTTTKKARTAQLKVNLSLKVFVIQLETHPCAARSLL
jgi:hypothetical protein